MVKREVDCCDELQGLTENFTVEDMFYLQDVNQRKLFMTTEISSAVSSEAIRHIMQYNKDDQNIPVEERKPIIIYIDSYGGYVDAGFAIIDIIQASKTPVYVVNVGCCYSMALLIYIAGHKRYATKNAKFLLHDGSNFVSDSSNKARDLMKFNDITEQRIQEFVVGNTKITDKLYKDRERVEWYMYASDAKEVGIVDSIIGEDADIDEVI